MPAWPMPRTEDRNSRRLRCGLKQVMRYRVVRSHPYINAEGCIGLKDCSPLVLPPRWSRTVECMHSRSDSAPARPPTVNVTILGT